MQAAKRRRSDDTQGKRARSRTVSSYSNIREGTRPPQVPQIATQRPRRNVATPQPSHQAEFAANRPPSSLSAASTRTFGGTNDGRNVAADAILSDDAELEDDALNETIMAVHVTDRGALGCAYYSARLRKMFVMEDQQTGAVDIVDSLKLFVDPTVILVSTKCTEAIAAKLDPELLNQQSSENGSSDDTHVPYLFECRPNSEFNYESGKAKLTSLSVSQHVEPDLRYVVPGDDANIVEHADGIEADHPGRQSALLRLACTMNLDSPLTVGCAGAVLAYLQRRKATTFLPGDRAADAIFGVAAIEMFSLQDTMFINVDTLLSLQITTTESHPNIQQQGPASKNWSRGSKEGLSVYGLFHHLAKTAQGRRALREYFLRPCLSLETIEERQNTISALLRPDNAVVLERLIKTLRCIKDIQLSMIGIRKGITSGVNQARPIATSVWSGIRQFAFSTLELTDVLEEAVGFEQLAIIQKIGRRFDKSRLAAVGRAISETVDFDMSKDARRTVVLDGIDQDLDDAKQTYEAIEDMLSKVAVHIALQVATDLQSKINVIFFPQIGFLISVEHGKDGVPIPYQGPDPDHPWEKMFMSATHAYYKNSNTLELDDQYGDIWGRVLDMEIAIIQHMAEQVLEHEDLLNETSNICGELDSLVALARGAAEYKLVRPRMTEQNIVKIEGGRHILQELTVPAFVPNDTYLLGGCGDDEAPDPRGRIASADPRIRRPLPPDAPSMLMLTGPNYSGKSIYLKQVAIVVYMAHIGSFVPAQSAIIGLTDAILTRISTRESVSRIQSAFMNDLQQASIALNMATRRSLLIIDEFGKGTESYDGAGLATGVFEHLLQRDAQCPKVIGATHFHEIFEAGFLPPRPTLAFAHMQVRISADDNNNNNKNNDNSKNAARTADVPSPPAAVDQITYLYNLRPGRNTSSYGTMCAAINGIDPHVVERADTLIGLAARGEDLVEACARVPEEERKDLIRAESIARHFLMLDDFKRPREILEDLLAVPMVVEAEETATTTATTTATEET